MTIKITPVTKRFTAGIISLVLGLGFAWGGIRVLSALGSQVRPTVDYLVSALVISGGTEGFNSIMKFMGYKKDSAKPENLQKGANKRDKTAAQPQAA